MQFFFKILLFFFLTSFLQAKVFSFFWENDVVSKKDKHYTNGTTYMYLSDKNTNTYDSSFYKMISNIPTLNNNTKYQSLGLNYSHLVFTPSNLEKKEKLIGDLPYAGVITLDFILFKWSDTFFHEYMLTLGMVGPSTKTKQIQKEFHKISGNRNPKGWDNQLKDDFLYNFSYAYGQKTNKKYFSYGQGDINYTLRFDMGNYNQAIQVGTNLRYGNNFPNNFNSVGRFIGSNENKLLNIDSKKNKRFGWSLSYGLAYNYTNYFYITDHDKSYKNENIDDIISQLISLDTYFNKIVFSLNIKSSRLTFKDGRDINKKWGGFSLKYIF